MPTQFALGNRGIVLIRCFFEQASRTVFSGGANNRSLRVKAGAVVGETRRTEFEIAKGTPAYI